MCFNEDGSATINPPHSFLVATIKQWDSSLIGHFVGGSFSFKFVREQAMKLWGNLGLAKVFFNSKGYYTFKFNTIVEKDKILALNVRNIGGKPLYLLPWIEGSNFQRNVLRSVPTWIRLIDVPHSYWSHEVLGYIASAVRKPLKLDVQTEKLEPMKFTGVQVHLLYAFHRPAFVCGSILSDVDGSEVKVKVLVEYAQLPLSCSICEAFGQSDSKCAKNPNA